MENSKSYSSPKLVKEIQNGFVVRPEVANEVLTTSVHISAAEAKIARSKERCLYNVTYAEPGMDAKQNLTRLIQDGYNPSRKNLYIVGQIMDNKEAQYGIQCLTFVGDENKVRDHESTLDDKILQKYKTLSEIHACIEPVFLFFESKAATQELETLITKTVKEREPFITVSRPAEKVTHSFWEFTEAETEKALEILNKNVEVFVIADGHHRMSAARKYYKNHKQPNCESEPDFAYMMSIIYPSCFLKLQQFDRHIRKSEYLFDKEKFLTQLSKTCDITRVDSQEKAKPEFSNNFGLIFKDEFYQVKFKTSLSRTESGVSSLDVSRISQILEETLGIKDSKSDHYLDFIPGGEDMVVTDSDIMGILTYPCTLEDVIHVARKKIAQKPMPPHSTLFLPKPLSGLLIELWKE